MASLEDADSVSPELGLWLKESAHGQGFGREVVAALVEWGHATLHESHAAVSREQITLRDLSSDDWILFPRSINPVIYDGIIETATEEGIPTRQAHEIMTAQQAFYLVSEGAGVAILPKPSVLGLYASGIVVLPLSDPALSFETCLIMRRDDDSKLVNDFARAFLRKYVPSAARCSTCEIRCSGAPVIRMARRNSSTVSGGLGLLPQVRRTLITRWMQQGVDTLDGGQFERDSGTLQEICVLRPIDGLDLHLRTQGRTHETQLRNLERPLKLIAGERGYSPVG